MNITSVQNNTMQTVIGQQTSAHSGVKGIGTGFAKNLSIKLDNKEEKIKETKETIEKMLTDIEELRQQMDFDLTVDNVLKYKKIIKSFLEYYVENAMETRDVHFRTKEGYPEKLRVVKKVEEGIKDLDDTMALLDTRRGHLDMLQKIGEINGMVLNLRL